MSSNNAVFPKPPAHLSPKSKSIWREQVKAQEPGYFTDADVPSLEALVAAISSLRSAIKALDEHGSMFTKGSQGQLIQHPAVRIQSEAIRLINQTSQRLAIDPTSRKANAGDDDDYDDDPDLAGLLPR